MLRVMAVGVVVLTVAACGSGTPAHPVATRVVVTPTPSRLVLSASAATHRGESILEHIAAKIPRRMPRNPRQGICHTGTTVTITVRAKVYRYGPCAWPPSIERVRQAFLRANDVVVHPSQTAGASLWRLVFADWYDGRFDRWHPCGAVREAIRRLPSTLPMFSSVHDDLLAYAHGVC